MNAGKLIDLFLRERAAKKDLTNVTKEIGEEVGLSGRQISRMRDYDGYPEDKAIAKLITAMPELDVLDPVSFFSRLLSSNRSMAAKQRWLSQQNKNNSISIISGWQAPLALNDKNLRRLTLESLSNGFTYNLLYPPLSSYPNKKEDSDEQILEMMRKWLDLFWRGLKLEKEEIDYNLSTGKASAESANKRVVEKLDTGLTNKIINIDLEELQNKKIIDLSYLTDEDDLGFFSLFRSDYNIIYNLEEKYQDRKSSERYGLFNVEGHLIPPSNIGIDNVTENSLLSKGWLYYSTDKYQQISRAYQQIGTKMQSVIDQESTK
jgi:hypothetical protein